MKINFKIQHLILQNSPLEVYLCVKKQSFNCFRYIWDDF